VKATLLLRERRIVAEDAFVELVVWQVPAPVAGSAHRFKYRLAFVVDGVCVLRYDTRQGRAITGTLGEEQSSYVFTTPAQLLDDFWRDVDHWRA
jgi:hypothetical protein